ncbi:MAG: hypothetical protein GVY36_04110 [Verrucomicrobia bacterium]|jgi:predicted transcriptional regulator/predicted nucleic acid-binding protein|nr:hypothetical protein [Verrucomicrobiota bacterium]
MRQTRPQTLIPHKNLRRTKTWRALGFIPIDEKPGRSAEGLPLTLWCYRISDDDELGLWKADTTDDVMDVGIDAHIFYDFDEEENPSSEISKGLLNDFLLDTLNLWVTDELFVEIDRQPDDQIRRRSLERAKGMPRITHNAKLAEDFYKLLIEILPHERISDRSDIQHIAKIAASEVNTFVTKDEKVLNKAGEIKAATGVTVVHPTDLVSHMHEMAEKETYSPSLVSGLTLKWQRIKGEDLSAIDLAPFQETGEKKGALLETLRAFLAKPLTYHFQLLQSEGKPVAIRVLNLKGEVNSLSVPLARLSRASDAGIFGSFILADTLSFAVERKCSAVEFKEKGHSAVLAPILRRMEFLNLSDGWVKFVSCEHADRASIEARLTKGFPELKEPLCQLSDLELEQVCAPLLSSPELPNFLVPIKPSFAMGLIDHDQAANDLFGSNGTALLRWENVYYRAKSRHKMLRAPARILWYVSGDKQAIIGISHLDEVQIDKPKELFRKYRKFGVLEWRDLYAMCGEDTTKEIMALKFSRTFLFRRPINLTTMRGILQEDGISESLQSPSCIPFSTLTKIYDTGFSS